MNDLPLPSLEKSITHVRMKLSSRLAPRGDPRSRSCSILSILSYPRKKEDELRNETSWESIERSEKLGDEWVGERTLTLNARRRKQGLGGRSVEGTRMFVFPRFRIPRSGKRLLLFLRFPRFFLPAFARLV